MEGKEPVRVAKLLAGYRGTWAIAGGWAIDLFLNQETRKHQDIEVFILRAEQLKFKNYLTDWQFRVADAGQLNPWNNNEYLELPLHEIHGHNEFGEAIEVLLNEEIYGNWQFRRKPAIEYPMKEVIISADLHIPILTPEIVLLYKAKTNQEKDKHDLKATLPKLKSSKVHTLKKWLIESYGKHEWLAEIEKYLL